MFKFKYQKILNIKYEIEENKKLKLAEAIMIMNNIRDSIAELEVKKSNYYSKLQNSLNEGMSVSEYSVLASGRKYFKKKSDDLNERLIGANQNISKIRKELNEAVQERKKYEVIKEKLKIQYNEKIKKENSEIIEELISYNTYSQLKEL